MKYFFYSVVMLGLLLIFINVCVDSQTYTDEERCALCWVNKKSSGT